MLYNFESVKQYIESFGYKLLSDKYISSQLQLEMLCPNGHPLKHTFSKFKYRVKDNICRCNPVITIDKIQEYIKPKGFILLSTIYKDGNTKLDVQCSKGHIWSITWGNLRKGNGCPDCYGNRKYSKEQINSYLNKFNYKLDDEYINISEKTNIICPNGHTYSVRLHDFSSKGARCVTCSYQTSNAEQELLAWFQWFYPEAKKVKFYDINPAAPKEYRNKELDIYIPSLKLAIEYCGLYWHSDASGKKYYKKHREKLDWCRDNGVRLITLFEDEWLSRKDQVKNLLLSVMNQNTIKVGARFTELRGIDKATAKAFISTNHIQPLSGSIQIAFGLYYQNKLIGCITGSKHHRQGHTSLVLQRLCFTAGFQVAGGASKLFKALKDWAKGYGYTDIISWSDNRISEGNVYKQLGFTFKTETNPDYSYVKEGYYNKRHSKQSLKKTEEERLSGKSEYDLRKDQGYYRIYDCGKKTWIYDII